MSIIGVKKMTISDRVFEILAERHITQKDFSEKTRIPQSTISDWRKKSTNPASDKIMIICDVLEVSPYYLLTGVKSNREDNSNYLMIANDSDEGKLLEMYSSLDDKLRQRIFGYISAMADMK